MKKFLHLFLAAVLGGMVTVGMNHFLFTQDVDRGVSVTIPHRSEAVPASLVGHLKSLPATLPDFTVVAEMTVNTVVHIRSEFKALGRPPQDIFGERDLFDFFFGPRGRTPAPQRPAVGTGSGVIVSHDGYIITNHHVVANASLIEVTLNDNRTYEAEVVGNDPTTDLALLRIREEGLPYIEFGDSDALLVGEWVLAVGNPFNLASTVTAGIVSAKGRNINILTEDMAIESFIQTDAAVNRGNSGGALVNTHGELVGINTAIASTTGTFAGYSFAVPSNIAQKVMEDLLEFGEVQRGLLGVEITEMTGRRAEEKGMGVNRGAFVERVHENSAAAEAGLISGDVITGIDQATIRNPAELIETVGRKRPGDEIEISYYRNGERKETTAVLKNIYGEVGSVSPGRTHVTEILGARFESLTEEELERLNISHGVRVVSVSRGALSSAGVRRGFVITHVGGQQVHSPRDIEQILAGQSGGVLLEGVYPDGRRGYYGIGLD